MSSSKQNVVVGGIALALLLTSHLAAGAEGEAITSKDTSEFPIGLPCFGHNSICIGACIIIHYTGGFCGPDGKCVCTKQSLADMEAGGPSQQPAQPPLRGMGMLN